MSTDPSQIRAQVDALLAELPDVPDAEGGMTRIAEFDIDDFDIDDVARRLEEAHEVLVNALESVEKG